MILCFNCFTVTQIKMEFWFFKMCKKKFKFTFAFTRIYKLFFCKLMKLFTTTIIRIPWIASMTLIFQRQIIIINFFYLFTLLSLNIYILFLFKTLSSIFEQNTTLNTYFYLTITTTNFQQKIQKLNFSFKMATFS